MIALCYILLLLLRFNEKVLSLPDSLPLCRPPDSALPRLRLHCGVAPEHMGFFEFVVRRQHEFARLEMTNIVVSRLSCNSCNFCRILDVLQPHKSRCFCFS